MAKISVIVPVYNVEVYLDKCVKSIVNQSYRDLEIILVDDGSLDRSSELCDMWAQKDRRIRVIHQKNKGLSGARNAGLHIAKGDYLGFVDSDDYIALTMFEQMISAIQESNAELCICGVQWVNEDQSIYTKVAKSPIKNEIIDREKAFYKLSDEKDFYYITVWNKLYKKSIFDKIRFPENRIHEDEFLIHHIFNQCSRIVSIKNELYYYVQRSNSITHSYSVRRLDAAWALYDRYLFFSKEGYKDLSFYVLRKCYNNVLNNIERCDVIQNKKEFDCIVKVLIKALWNNLRVFKLILHYYKKILRGNAAKIKAKVFLKIAFLKGRSSEDKIILLATPIHGNLGDQAIVYAEYDILKKIFPSNRIIEIPSNIYVRFPQMIEESISHSDKIIIDGGGNLGTLWINEDDKIRDIIERFHTHSILIFPQTCFYDDTMEGRIRLQRNLESYNAAKNLSIMLRDSFSYDFMRNNFPNVKTYFVPDIVLRLHPYLEKAVRKGVLLCFRKDREKVIDEYAEKKLIDEIKKAKVPYTFTSTVVSKYIDYWNRKKELMKKWREFSMAQLVITDRLHAMIFAAITETPCIAMDNKSKKVKGVYEWIRDLPYVQYADDISTACELIQDMLHLKECKNTYSFPTEKVEKILMEKEKYV